MVYIALNNIVEEESQVKAILDIQLPENGAQVSLDSPFGYVKCSRDGFIVAALVHHARNLKFPWRKAINCRTAL